jgi:acyl-[acyl-carrier-protein]-phospholipid O-acyltransferase/long-chain-fatty-acid--[acyl-carrier-protein] ligase
MRVAHRHGLRALSRLAFLSKNRRPHMPATLAPGFADDTVFAAVLQAARRHGGDKAVLDDADRQPLTYRRLVLATLVLGARLAALSRPRETLGVMLPNSNGLVVTLLGLNAFGRAAAMLNFTAGARNISSGLRTACVRTVLTSRRFVDAGKLDDLVAAIEATPAPSGGNVRVVYLEDVRRGIGAKHKALGLLQSAFAGRVHRAAGVRPDHPAVVLFTSGTEGLPKAVVLTNANLVANARQMFAHASGILSAADITMNPLPMFHSFGLTAGTLMPLMNGLKTVLYPSPLHYRQVAALIGATGATLLFATDTFLQGYARAAQPGELASIRLVIAGAERVKDQTRKLWAQHPAVLLEGYGATECAPVISCNLPADNRPGTVGSLLPGIEARLEPVEGIHDGGRLVVRGPNVMAGYMTADRPGVLQPPPGGWHDTGDIVSIEDGIITIRGRAKRFAKIGGEMVSLAAVESLAQGLWPEAQHVVISLPDARKGETLTLVTDKPDADREALLTHARTQGFPELWVPKAIMVAPTLPVLGSGKIDLAATHEMVRNARALL